MNFAELFRKSTFARFTPKLPFIFSKYPSIPVLSHSPLQFEAIPRDPHFGLKAEPPGKLNGKSVDFISLKAVDGDFGLPGFEDATDRVLKHKIYKHLEEIVSSGNTHHSALHKVPGRVLESCEGGFLIGIGPVRAHLPQSEIPAGVGFNYFDMLDRKAYYFYLKSVSLTGKRSNEGAARQSVDILSFGAGAGGTIGVGNKKQSSLYSKFAQNQGFKVILTLRK